MTDTFYQPLTKSISLLAVDDEPFQREIYVKTIAEHKLYTVNAVSSAEEAELFLQSPGNISICLMDLGIDDIRNDEFYLLKKYAKQLPFIVISAARDLRRGFQARDLGCASLFAKPVDFFAPGFWNVLMNAFLDRIILPSLPENTLPVLNEVCRTIHRENPRSVSQWAALSGITESYLRRLWSEGNMGSPKHTLFLYEFYKEALTYYNSLLLSETDEHYSALRQPDIEDHRKKVRYFNQYKNELLSITGRRISADVYEKDGDLCVAEVLSFKPAPAPAMHPQSKA